MSDPSDIDDLKRQLAEYKTIVIEGVMIPQGQQIGRLFENHYGHQLTSLVALSFIVEKLGVPIDDVAARFDAVCQSMGQNYQTPHVGLIKDLVLNALRTAYSVPTATKPAQSWAPRVIDGGV